MAPAPPVINRCPVGVEQELRRAMMGSDVLDHLALEGCDRPQPAIYGRVVRSGVERYQLVVSP